MYFIELFSVLFLISISSSLLLPDKLSVLLCKDNCKYFRGCTSVRFDSIHLQCELIFGTEKTGDTGERGIRLFKNITVKEGGQLFELPLTLEPGMKLIVHAAIPRGAPLSDFSFTKDAVHPKDVMKWFHTVIRWSDRKVSFYYQGSTRGSVGLKGKFPISDKTNFTLTLELTELKTKIYANKIPIKTVELVSGIVAFNVQKFSHIHAVAIQKTSEECEKVSTGIP